jgi:glycosyltransferase involved in cell wall biosynthesis
LPLEHYAEQALQRFLTQSGTQAVLAQFGPTGVAVLDACERVGIPLIVHFRGYDAYKYDVVERYAESYRRLLTRAGAIAVVSRAMREQLLQLGARPERLHYVPSGVDPSLFADGRPRAQPPHFVAVSRFIEKKGPGHTIRAFAMIATDIPAARLTMIGDGPLLAACRRQVAEARLGDRVRFLGAVPHTAVAARLREARAFVQHSLRASDGDAEGTPNAVVEAGATGIPVIATRHMGIREAVVEEVTGLLVDEGDVEGMAAAMRRVARDADFAARLGEAGRRYVAAHFNRVDCLRRLMEIVRDAVDRNDARYAVAR